MSSQFRWDDAKSISLVDGSFSDFPPLLTLMGIHYTKGDFKVQLTGSSFRSTLIFQKGVIIGCAGIHQQVF